MYRDIRYRDSCIRESGGVGDFTGTTREKFNGGLTC